MRFLNPLSEYRIGFLFTVKNGRADAPLEPRRLFGMTIGNGVENDFNPLGRERFFSATLKIRLRECLKSKFSKLVNLTLPVHFKI